MVTGQRVDVFLEGGLEDGKIWEVQDLIDFADFADGITFELFESNLGVVSGGDKGTVFEEGVIHQAVKANKPVVEAGHIWPLEVVPGDHELESASAGLEDGERITMDMDEFGVRKKVQEEPDAGGVRRRFQNKRTVVAPLEFFQEGVEGVAPFGEFCGVNVAKGEIFFEFFFLARKNPGDAGRHECHGAESELLFLWRSDSHLNIVHRPAFGQKERQDRGVFLFGGEKRLREADLIAVRITKTLVLRDEIVKVRRAIAPMAQDEDGRLDGDVFEKGFETAIAFSPIAVLDALSGDGDGAEPEGGVDGKSFAELGPLMKGDAGEHTGTDEAEEGVTPVVRAVRFWWRHAEDLVIEKRKVEGDFVVQSLERVFESLNMNMCKCRN